MPDKVAAPTDGRPGIRQPGADRGERAGSVSSEDVALSRECPTCYAEPGEMCITPSGYEAKKIHKKRFA